VYVSAVPAEGHPVKDPDQSANSPAILAAQEDEYRFPYHYVTRFTPESFRQHFVDSWGINYAATIDFIVDRIVGEAPGSLIDIGCGDGRLAREIHQRAAVPRVCGVDTSSRAIGLARAMNQDIPAIEFIATDISARPDLGPFDTAVLMEVIEHIPPDATESFVRAARALLKRGGHLHVTVPHVNKPVEYKHFRHFTAAGIVACLEGEFEILEVIPFERRGLRRRLLELALCNRLFVLNHRRLLDALYRWHGRHLFAAASERDCQRIYVRAAAR
jgi:2-polyprenyl-3-methyl-5-hydroxy-6-metoxy-1,4-benzoquinol methylase